MEQTELTLSPTAPCSRFLCISITLSHTSSFYGGDKSKWNMPENRGNEQAKSGEILKPSTWHALGLRLVQEVETFSWSESAKFNQKRKVKCTSTRPIKQLVFIYGINSFQDSKRHEIGRRSLWGELSHASFYLPLYRLASWPSLIWATKTFLADFTDTYG